ncbi:MAG: glycine dehydrogenase, partial [Dehalococcoidia bacterium]
MTRAYIPMTDPDREAMLAAIGVASADELFKDIPAAGMISAVESIPPPISEMELLQEMKRLGGMNT